MNWCYGVLSYNHSDHTRNCIRSVLNTDPSARLYLIHNGTEKKQRLALETEFPNVNHMTLDNNRGYSGGLNYGLSEIFARDEDLVFVLTNDTELVAVPNQVVEADVILPLIINKRTQKIDSYGGYFIPGQGHLYHHKDLHGDFIDRPGQLTYLPGSAFLISKKAFYHTGGFWEKLGTYWEDVDWSQRLKQHGYPLIRRADFKLTHKIGKTCHKDKFYTTYSYQRNRLVVSWRYSGSLEKTSLILRSLGDMIKWTSRAIRKSNYESLRLYFRALGHAVEMIKENAR